MRTFGLILDLGVIVVVGLVAAVSLGFVTVDRVAAWLGL